MRCIEKFRLKEELKIKESFVSHEDAVPLSVPFGVFPKSKEEWNEIFFACF